MNLRRIVCFFAVGLALYIASPAQAITPKSFFMAKNSNIEMIVHVLGQAEMGGIDGQLKRAQESLALAKEATGPTDKLKHAKMAWFYAFHSAFLCDTAVAKDEQEKYKKPVANALVGAAQIMLISQENFEPLMKGTVKLFTEGEKRLEAQMNEEEVAAGSAKADSYYDSDDGDVGGEQPPSPPAAQVKPTGEEQRVAALLQVARTVKAKSEKARGRAFPTLTANAQAYKKLDRSFMHQAMKRPAYSSQFFLPTPTLSPVDKMTGGQRHYLSA